MVLDPAAHRDVVLAHRARRDARFHSPTGWLTLIERVVLEEGNNTLPIGTVVVAPGVPPLLDPAPGVRCEGELLTAPIELDADGSRSVELGGRSYQVGRRREQIVVRVRDPRAAALREFR